MQNDHDAPRDTADGAAGDPLIEGAVLDGHGEVQPDAANRKPGNAAEHRRDADALESHSEQAADETRGAVPPDRDEPVD